MFSAEGIKTGVTSWTPASWCLLFGQCPHRIACLARSSIMISGSGGGKVGNLTDSCSQFSRPHPGIAAVNDPAQEPELFPGLASIVANVPFSDPPLNRDKT